MTTDNKGVDDSTNSVSCMGNEYRQARATLAKTKNGDTASQSMLLSTLVDDRPYFPFWDAKSENELKKVTAKLLRWDSTPLSEMSIRTVQGGNTNKLYCVQKTDHLKTGDDNSTFTSSDTPSIILIRIFGGTLIDRDEETATYAQLARQGLALPFWGRFGNGRLEGWYEGRTLIEADLQNPTISNHVAQAMATLHAQMSLSSPSTPKELGSPRPMVVVQMEDWLHQALQQYRALQNSTNGNSTKLLLSESDKAKVEALGLNAWADEYAYLQSHVLPVSSNGDHSDKYLIGFCHNDVLASNMLWKDARQKLQLIDFEYGGPNYLAYDIANHFNEYAGGTDPSSGATPKYEHFPDTTARESFCRTYLERRKELLSQGSENHHDSPQDLDKQVSQWMYEIEGFVLANHLVWALWAVNSAFSEGCREFDYLHYAKCRMERYHYDKRNFEKYS